MRLWHQALIPYLDNQRLCDLHQTCCNLRGLGWGKKNRLINFVYEHPFGEEALVAYYYSVLLEMDRRHFNFETLWMQPDYCGKRRERRQYVPKVLKALRMTGVIYPQQDNAFLKKDIQDLIDRGAPVSEEVRSMLEVIDSVEGGPDGV